MSAPGLGTPPATPPPLEEEAESAMTESGFGTERSLDDPVEGLSPRGDETPGDYVAGEGDGESPETGVLYEPTGEPEATPHDLELTRAEEDDEL